MMLNLIAECPCGSQWPEYNENCERCCFVNALSRTIMLIQIHDKKGADSPRWVKLSTLIGVKVESIREIIREFHQAIDEVV